MEQKEIRLVELMNLYVKLGDIKNGKKIAHKLIDIDKKKLMELSKCDINQNNYDDIMSDLRTINNHCLTDNKQAYYKYHEKLNEAARLLKRL
jgi:hypothetical protein